MSSAHVIVNFINVAPWHDIMDDSAGLSWTKIITIIFVIAAIIVLLIFLTMALILPMVND